MSEIKDRDILKYLDGHSDKSQKKAISSWAKSSEENGLALKLYKTIHEEASNLGSYNLIDESAEWKNFSELKSKEIGEKQILNHFDGFATYSEKKTVEQWAAKSEDNKKELKVYDLILKEAPHLSNIKPVNPKLEWSNFQSKISDQPSTLSAIKGGKTLKAEEKKGKSKFVLWQKLALAASFLLLVAVVYTLRPVDPYSEYATTDFKHTVVMSDGSEIELAENSTLRYPKSLKNMTERRLYLQGEGKFSVAENKEKPFVVEVNDAIGVEVLGTVFKVNGHTDFIEVVENIEGMVRAFELTSPANGVVLEKGEKFGFDGRGFVDMNPETEVVDNAKDHEIIYILDYLMVESNWKVVSSPYTEFEEKGIVHVDLDQPYEQILEDLLKRADFEYTALSCEGCFIITKFRTLTQ